MNAAPQGARLPLVVLAIALAVGTALVVRLHVHGAVASPGGATRSLAATPDARASDRATP